jgi:hypothetical protein
MERKSIPILIFAVVIALAGCTSSGTPTTPAPPSNPQVTVANLVNVVAQATDGTVKAAIAARDQGKCSQSDLNAIENLVAPIAIAGKSIDQELNSTDAWAVQKVKIVQMLNAAGLAQLKGHISPLAQSLVTSLLAAVNQISAAVGGPQI